MDVRIDKWLWAARFFKQRNLAAEAVKSGHVDVNGVRCKPAKLLHVGDRVVVRKGQMVWDVAVLNLSDQRGSAALAQALYDESTTSIEQRAIVEEQRKFRALTAPAPLKRPDKFNRRKIIRFKNIHDLG